MLSRICGIMGIKREAFFLAIHYLDTYISQYSYVSLKLVGLASLPLALNIDDAEMVSQFCSHYLYNPERTVKKNGSSNQVQLKQKRESVVSRD